MDHPPRLLVSACLLGSPVRYDGLAKPFHHDALTRWWRDGRVTAVCPEMLAGFPTPRPPAEIASGDTGLVVLDGKGRVVESSGDDVTQQFLAGAFAALELARKGGCQFALLTDGSPSCGSKFVYDGRFTGTPHAGEGVAAALFRRDGITVFAPDQIVELAALMDI